MGANSAIEWTHHSFNPWIGCTKVSPACDHCYAESGSRRLGAQRGLKLWQGDRYFTGDDYWTQPARWDRAAQKAGQRHRVFCASYADVFEDRRDLDGTRARLWGEICRTPHLDWLLLTKRPERILGLVPPVWARAGFPRNVWLGTTCEDQAHYDTRWPILAEVVRLSQVRVSFLSHEPGLGPLTLRCHGCGQVTDAHRAPDGGGCAGWFPNWVITGGESGSSARPYDVGWARDLLRQTRESPIRLFVKQMGKWVLGDDAGFRVSRWLLEDGRGFYPPIIGPNVDRRPDSAIGFGLYDAHGGDPDAWALDLRVRQWPEVRA